MITLQSLTQKYSAVKLFGCKIYQGTLDGSKKPAVVYSSDPFFVATKVTNPERVTKNHARNWG